MGGARNLQHQRDRFRNIKENRMARMGDQPQPKAADHSYSPYHVARSTKNGGSRGPGGK